MAPLILGFRRGLDPWDDAAGVLIIREAGGHAAMLDGSPYRPASAKGKTFWSPATLLSGRACAINWLRHLSMRNASSELVHLSHGHSLFAQ